MGFGCFCCQEDAMSVLGSAFWLSLLLVGVASAAVDSLFVRLIGSWDSPANAYEVALVVSGDTGSIDYACVAGDSGLSVISIVDPEHPTETGRCDILGSSYGVAVSDDHAYVVGDDNRLHVVYIADPAHPVEVGHCDTPGDARGVAVVGDFAYVANGDNGLRVISVSDPSHPVEVGYYTGANDATGVAVTGDYVYVADDGDGLCVVSIADPAHPVEVGRCGPPVTARDVAVAGDYAYVADGQSGLRVISITDPSDPTEVGHLDSLGSVTFAVAVDGGRAYITNTSFSAEWCGLRVISVADPSNPVEAGHYQFSRTSKTFYSVAIGGGCIYMTHWPALKILEFYGGGVEEAPNAGVRTTKLPTIAKGVLFLPEAASHKPQAASLLDAGGRKVLDLRPGANDVAHFAPGVYFVLSEPSAVGRQPSAVVKVIISK
jgi:hypothetical protein